MENNELVLADSIKNKIYTVRGKEVMLDEDLALLYRVETKQINRAVKRNIQRFPIEFMFQLTELEYESLHLVLKSRELLKFQSGTSKENRGGRRYLPYVFTEQGVSMLSAVLRSQTAVEVSIHIINAFVAMRKFISLNAQVFQRLDRVELKQIGYDQKFEQVFKAIEDKSIKPSKGIFFDGQIFDAHKFVSELIKGAKKSIILFDNYIDESVLALFSECKGIKIIIYTKNITPKLELDVRKFNAQYGSLEIRKFIKSHDRFMILDEEEIYHFGASLKDLGKKWFAFSTFKKEAVEILSKLK